MPLKDLIAQKAKFTEEAIEEIVSDYVRYDIEEREIIFTPKASELSNKARALVFLVAQEGWQFVLDEAIDLRMTPSRIAEMTGIHGPSLRPILGQLKDLRLISAKASHYSVRSSSLEFIKKELSKQTSSASRPRRRSSRKQSTRTENNAEGIKQGAAKRPIEPSKPRKNSTRGDSKISLSKAFDDLIQTGFFDTGRTLAEVRTRLAERAVLVSSNRLPSYLLPAVRGEKLTREKKKINGRSVWVYTTVKS